MRTVKATGLLLATVVALTGCADPAPTQPGDEVTHASSTTKSDIMVTFIGQVSNEAVYTTCYNGDRLFFWDTFSDGAMTIHPSDPTCAS